jgi:HSP20 family protein
MTETTEKETTTDIEKQETTALKRWVYPEICAFENEDETGYDIDVYLPGAEKDSVKLEMNKDSISIKGEAENISYRGIYGLCCPVDPSKATSTYKEGLLKIHVPYKEIEMKNVDVRIE